MQKKQNGVSTEDTEPFRQQIVTLTRRADGGLSAGRLESEEVTEVTEVMEVMESGCEPETNAGIVFTEEDRIWMVESNRDTGVWGGGRSINTLK